MAYTSPRTWVAGEVPTAAMFNTHLRDNMAGSSVVPTAGASITISTTNAYQRCGSVIVNVDLTTTAALASGATLFTLPAGYQPPALQFPTIVNATLSTVLRVDLDTAGAAKVQAAVANGTLLRGMIVIPL